MDAEASPSGIASHLRRALGAARHALAATSRLVLDIALPTLCVSCREPVHGEGVVLGRIVVYRATLLPAARDTLCL